MSHYLITGGAGFIGSHLCESLLAAGHRVRVLDNLSSGKRQNLPADVELMVGDVRDAATVRKALEGVEGCFHLAAVASVKLSIENPQETHSINLGGTQTIVEALRRQPIPLVFASSAAVYGDGRPPLSESCCAKPLTPYGADKLASEQAAHGLAFMGLRLFNVYGPRQDPHSPYSGVISIFLDRMRKNQPITIFGDGEQTRDFVYVGDVVQCLQAAMEKLRHGGFHVLNVCTGTPSTINQLADTIAKATGHYVVRHHQPAREGDIRFSVGDTVLLEKTLDRIPRTALEDGIRRMLETPKGKWNG